jgi:putative hydrolase of the HAD superfamily
MIKAIFFDFDGVLTTDDKGTYTTCKNLSVLTGIDLDKILACYRKYIPYLNLNKTTHKDIWSKFCDCVGKDIDIELLKDAFADIPINEKMFNIVKSLKKKHKLGIITNNSKERFNIITKKFNLESIFDCIIISADVGCLKDEKNIFEAALECAGCEAEECIFIENQEKNLRLPSKMGFKIIYHDDKQNDIKLFKENLRKFNVDL